MPSPRTAIAARWTVVPGGAGGFEVLEGTTVLVEGNRIADVVRGAATVPADRRVDVPGGILVPGFVNLHNHALNGPVFRGIVDDAGPEHPADGIVYSLLMPLGDHAAHLLSDDEVLAVYKLALLEMLRSGTTATLDMPRAAHRAFFPAAADLGLRAFGAPYVFSTPTRGADATGRPIYTEIDEDASLDAALRLADEFDQGEGGPVRVGIGPHATDTCSPRLLARVARAARERGTVVSIHVAQSRAEVDTVDRRHGMTPVELLRETGLVGPDVVAAHCVYATDDDLAVLRDTGTSVAHCPLTFARSGVTVAFDRFHRHGVRTGIGTDAYSFDFLAEMRAAGFISKLTSGDGGDGSAPSLLRAATEVGAAALGEPDLGRIEPGCLADLIVVDLGGAAVQPVHDPLRNLVWNASPADVSLVMVDGNVLVEDGVVRACDEAAVIGAGAAAVEKLWESAQRSGLLPAGGRP